MKVLLTRCPRCHKGKMEIVGDRGTLEAHGAVYYKIRCTECGNDSQYIKKEDAIVGEIQP